MAIPVVGERFRQFRIVSKAGEGGMGVVYRAHDERLGRDVTLYDIDEDDGAPFLVMEWVSGSSLAHASLARPCAEEEFLRIGLPVAEALAAAHTRGIVHRDLKPGNVLLGQDGAVKLVDFGLASFRDAESDLTRTAAIRGTAAYMSPEQASAGEVGPASDVFSFGALAYELLSGRPPFEGASLPAVLFAIVHAPHFPLGTRRPDVSPAIRGLVERCLEKRPEDRPSDGAELATELRRAEAARDLPQRPRVRAARPSGTPEIRFCQTADGLSIAYSMHGAGPILVRVLGWFTHLEMEWEWAALRLIWEPLGETHTVVRYDGREIGLSSPWTEEFTEESRQLDLDAVLGAVGTERVALYGISEGGWTAAQYASRHPERVSHLVIYGAYSRGIRFRPGYDPQEAWALETPMRKGRGRDTPQYRQIFTTAYFGQDADPGLVAHFNRLQRGAADGDTAARCQESLHRRDDARDLFAAIRTPTIVIHCRDDQIVPFEEGRRIASIIPGAQFLPLPTRTHYFPVDDDVTHAMADAIGRFTGQEGPSERRTG